MNGTVRENTAAVVESTKESKATYASIARKGIDSVGTPRSTKRVETPKSLKPMKTPKMSKPVTAGTSNILIGKPLSPPKQKRADQPEHEKGVWISGIHRDTTEAEIMEHIKGSIGIASTEFEVRKLVKKNRDITTYSFVSFFIGCKQANFSTLMQPMYWPSNSQIREFEIVRRPSTGARVGQISQQMEASKNSERLLKDPEQTAMDTAQSLITSFFQNANGNSATRQDLPLELSQSVDDTERFHTLPIYYDNVRSITNKRNISMKIELSIYKALCFTETMFDNGQSSSVYFPDKFNVYRCDRMVQTLRRSGGVAVLVHYTLRSNSVPINSEIGPDEASEFVVVEIHIKPRPLILYVCYMSVFDLSIALKHYHHVKLIVEKYLNHRIIVLGDFNLHDINWSIDEDDENAYLPYASTDHNANGNRSCFQTDALDFLDKMLSLPLSQLSNFRNNASNVLDLVFVNESDAVNVTSDRYTIIEQSQQDARHIPYEIKLDYSKSSSFTETVTVRQYKRGNYERMAHQLEAINFQHEFNMRDDESAYKFFIQTIQSLIEQNIPTRTIKKYSNKPKWWNKDIQHLKNRRNKLYKRKGDGPASMTEYEAAEKAFSDECDHRSDEFNIRTQENIKSNPSEFWKFVKMNGRNERYPDVMKYDDKIGTSTEEIVNLFADYFESIYVKDDGNWNFDDVYVPISGAEEINLSLFDIEAAIHSLDWKSGAGPDDIKPLVIKMCAPTIAWPIWLLYQKSFDSGKIAAAAKMSRVVPVHKKGDKANVTNYRVIAIQTLLLKIHEIAVKRKVSEKIQPQLKSAQHGFRDKRSVVTNLLGLSILAHAAFERLAQLDIFYGDYKTAFDKLVILMLIIKLARFGIGKKTARWICQYLVGRTNYVQIGNSKSTLYESPSGVPPGSSLGPLMFIVFINDIVDVVEFANTLLFADDIKLASIISDHYDTRKMQRDIDNVVNWNTVNRLFFNEEKCYIFSLYRHEPSFIRANYTMGDKIISRVEETSDLGVLVNRWFHPGSHIEQMTMKCRQTIGCIKHFSNGNFTKETQRILYVAYVRSRLEFASPIWNPAAQIYKDDIESVQKQFRVYDATVD
ncbi:uncharacterized protein LOC119083942 [Bradysia coprophila]|uniref:uncharacterized protein LOC119083942 n=1 Tax=Bradysia coprophila TaxID=38358 RepID=UPI00187D7B55|nr:uncharacterized protein LOC119083942 [Bradysia coprophila]